MITEEKALEIFCKVTGFSPISRYEAIKEEDRYLCWRKGGYGSRAYDSEVEVFFDGTVISWNEGKPIDVTDSILTGEELTLTELNKK